MGLRRFLQFGSSDPFEPDPVDTGVGKGTDRPFLGAPPSIAQGRISNHKN